MKTHIILLLCSMISLQFGCRVGAKSSDANAAAASDKNASCRSDMSADELFRMGSRHLLGIAQEVELVQSRLGSLEKYKKMPMDNKIFQSVTTCRTELSKALQKDAAVVGTAFDNGDLPQMVRFLMFGYPLFVESRDLHGETFVNNIAKAVQANPRALAKLKAAVAIGSTHELQNRTSPGTSLEMAITPALFQDLIAIFKAMPSNTISALAKEIVPVTLVDDIKVDVVPTTEKVLNNIQVLYGERVGEDINKPYVKCNIEFDTYKACFDKATDEIQTKQLQMSQGIGFKTYVLQGKFL